MVAIAVAVVLLFTPTKIDSSHSSEKRLDEPHHLISKYDRLFQRVGFEVGMDWHLLSAIAYKESRFEPTLRSRRGAVGLMQIMPLTAKHFNVPVELLEDPTLNVMISAKVLLELENSFNFGNAPKEERMKIILAGYNSGLTNLREARKAASKKGANYNRWDELKYYGKLNNPETRSFVDGVMRKWQEYVSYTASVSAE